MNTEQAQIQDELLKEVSKPMHRKRPSNWGLYLAVAFFNIVMLILDGGSAFSVYWATNIAFYGVMTFLAGFIPLTMHEILHFRPYASDAQKNIAKWGALAAVSSVIIVAILAVVVNIMGVAGQTVEIGMLIFIVVSAFGHAVAAAVYFYIDDGISAEQITVQMEARAIQKRRRNSAADLVLGLSRESINERKRIAGSHNSMSALKEILRQMGEDDDGDGIPNFIDPVDNRQRQRPRSDGYLAGGGKFTYPPINIAQPPEPHTYTLAELLDYAGVTMDQAVHIMQSNKIAEVGPAHKLLMANDMLPKDITWNNFAELFQEVRQYLVPVTPGRNGNSPKV